MATFRAIAPGYTLPARSTVEGGAAFRTVALAGIPDGVAGTQLTLDIMRRLVKQFRTDPELIALARSIVADVPAKSYAREAERLQNWVRSNIRYTQDVVDVETLQSPDVTLTLKHGDCDDQSVLLATLLNAIGHPVRFVAVGFAPDQFEHVLVETKIAEQWLPVETTEPVGFGEYPWTSERDAPITKIVRNI